jgi:hypothetical protein
MDKKIIAFYYVILRKVAVPDRGKINSLLNINILLAMMKAARNV